MTPNIELGHTPRKQKDTTLFLWFPDSDPRPGVSEDGFGNHNKRDGGGVAAGGVPGVWSAEDVERNALPLLKIANLGARSPIWGRSRRPCPQEDAPCPEAEAPRPEGWASFSDES